MKKVTNKLGLSLPIAVWCLMDNYNYDERPNGISTTTLLKPIQQIYLGRKCKDCIKEMEAIDDTIHFEFDEDFTKRTNTSKGIR